MIKQITFKPLISLFLILLFSLARLSYVKAEESEKWPDPPPIVAEAGILMEASTATILYEKNMEKTMYPASVTKILTALIAIENSSLDNQVTYSANSTLSLSYDAAKIGLKPGDVLTMQDSLYALLLPSANDAANGIAEHISGSNEDFAKLMNERAKSAGAINSNFTNPSGLFDENHYTTCYDIAMIMKDCLNNQTFTTISSSISHTLDYLGQNDKPIELINRNSLQIPTSRNYYRGIIAGKTGFLSQSGRTLVSVAKRDGMTLIMVIMKSTNESQFTDAISLFDYGFNNFKTINLSDYEKTFFHSGSDFLSYGKTLMDSKISSSFHPAFGENLVLMKNSSFEDLTTNISPINKENSAAKIDYYLFSSPVGASILLDNSFDEITKESPFLSPTTKNEQLGLKWQLRIDIRLLLALLILFFTVFFTIKTINRIRFANTIRKKSYYKKSKKLRF